MDSGNAGGTGSIFEHWLTGGSICEGLDVGTWRCKEQWFLSNILPDLGMGDMGQ